MARGADSTRERRYDAGDHQFDIDAYLVSNPDVFAATKGSRAEALVHYITHGHAERRNATIDNDADKIFAESAAFVARVTASSQAA